MNYLREALEIMAKRGHAQYTRCNAEGKVCVDSALTLAIAGQVNPESVEDSDLASSLLDEIGTVALEQYPERAGIPDMWGQSHPAVAMNNHPDTTLDDMCRVIEKAAIRHDEVVA